jgi:hypothetical protein
MGCLFDPFFPWTPAFAGVTSGENLFSVIPAKAGIQDGVEYPYNYGPIGKTRENFIIGHAEKRAQLPHYE